MGGLSIRIRDSAAGIILLERPGKVIVATPRADLEIRGAWHLEAEDGVFLRNRWEHREPLAPRRDGDRWVLRVERPRVIRLAVLIDRGGRELPISADYVGKTIVINIEQINIGGEILARRLVVKD